MVLNRLELTLLLIAVIIFSPIQTIINSKFVGTELIEDTDESKYGLMLLSIASVISQSVALLIQTLVPYVTYKRCKQSFQAPDSQKQKQKQSATYNTTHVISLLHILRHKYGFFLFLDQLVQELSFENIGIPYTLII